MPRIAGREVEGPVPGMLQQSGQLGVPSQVGPKLVVLRTDPCATATVVVDSRDVQQGGVAQRIAAVQQRLIAEIQLVVSRQRQLAGLPAEDRKRHGVRNAQPPRLELRARSERGG